MEAGRKHLPKTALPSSGQLVHDRVALDAAGAVFMEAGNCREYTALLAVHLTPELQAAERLELMDAPVADHVWPEFVQTTDTGEERRWVVDAWAEPPALLAEDSRLTHAPDRTLDSVLRAVDGPALMERYQRRKRELGDSTSPNVARREVISLMLEGNLLPLPKYDRPTHWDPRLAAALAAGVEREPAEPHVNLSAAEAARHYRRSVVPELAAHAVSRRLGMPVLQASALASQLVQEGLRLGELGRTPKLTKPRELRVQVEEMLEEAVVLDGHRLSHQIVPGDDRASIPGEPPSLGSLRPMPGHEGTGS